MSRILAIDYGAKRTGLAVTDILRLSINGLPTQPTSGLQEFLTTYLNEENVGEIVLGRPKHKDGTLTKLNLEIDRLKKYIEKTFHNIELHFIDESYTSVEAKEIILAHGIKKSKRREKALTDKVSAMIILQRFLEQKGDNDFTYNSLRTPRT